MAGWPVADYDQLAELYDETRGGERRGDEYAADVDAALPPGDGPILEIGVGTGVVALGLVRRGRAVVGLDMASKMLLRAVPRLGPVLVRADAAAMAIGDARIAHAYSVWVLQAVPDPERVLAEAARVIRPGGTYVVCLTQKAAPDDRVGQIVEAMGARIGSRSLGPKHKEPTTEQVLEWAGAAGFGGAEVRVLEREWRSAPGKVVDGIRRRMWAGLRALDEASIEQLTRPAIDALEALPPGLDTRRATADMVVLRR